jgi:hypothetical protein
VTHLGLQVSNTIFTIKQQVGFDVVERIGAISSSQRFFHLSDNIALKNPECSTNILLWSNKVPEG